MSQSSRLLTPSYLLSKRLVSRLCLFASQTPSPGTTDAWCLNSTYTTHTMATGSRSPSPSQKSHDDADTIKSFHGSSSKSDGVKGERPPRKRDTHFLCLPLVTDTSIPQLAESLKHFREVTTRSTRKKDDGEDRNEGLHPSDDDADPQSGPANPAENHAYDLLQPNTNQSMALTNSDRELQTLPATVHREPGTFHLTLGVMDLSRQEEMDRALSLLQKLDYTDIFQHVLSQQYETQSQSSQMRGSDGHARHETGARLASLDRPISPPTGAKTEQVQSEPFTNHRPPTIALTGLSTFPSAKSSRVFYAKPSPSPSAPFPLLQFGQAIRRKFREAGFITETRPLVLHATVANMKYAVQPRGGRTSKGKTWRYSKQKWTDGQVDAREIIKCFDHYGGNVAEYVQGKTPAEGQAREFVWATDIVVNTVAICKMGAEKSDDEVLGKVYPPVGQKLIFS